MHNSNHLPALTRPEANTTKSRKIIIYYYNPVYNSISLSAIPLDKHKLIKANCRMKNILPL